MKLGFFGTPEHSAKLLAALLEAGIEVPFVVTNEDKVAGRGKVLTPPPVKVLAQEKQIPVLQFGNLKSEEAKQEICKFEVDMYIVFAYGSIIPKEIFEFPKAGTINLHGSLLPKYRGASPIQAAILADDKETGLTLQYIVEELDAGDIISAVQVPITEDDTFGSILEKITDLGAKELLRLLKNFKGEKFPAKKQDSDLASICKKIKPEERKLDFAEPARSLFNKIRAFNPGNICFCEFKGKRVNVYRSRILDGLSTGNFPPGSFVPVDKRSLSVVTGDGSILILEEVQPENKKVMTGSDFRNGMRLAEGDLFK